MKGKRNIMNKNQDLINEIWKKYLESIGENTENTKKTYVVEHFEVTKESANNLLRLILEGKKRATAGCLWSYEYDNQKIFGAGDLTIVTDWDGIPGCIIQTKSAIIKKYNEITEEDAMKEGEGDLTIEYWRRVHKEYCQYECKRIGKKFEEDMPMVFEEFEVVFTLIGRKPMKVLVTYFSKTGNTKKIAEHIFAILKSKNHQVDMCSYDKINEMDLCGYDLCFIGSPCHSNDVVEPIKNVINRLTLVKKANIFGFVTHSTEDYGEYYQKWAYNCEKYYLELSNSRKINLIGYYHCKAKPNFLIKLFIKKWLLLIKKRGKNIEKTL